MLARADLRCFTTSSFLLYSLAPLLIIYHLYILTFFLQLVGGVRRAERVFVEYNKFAGHPQIEDK